MTRKQLEKFVKTRNKASFHSNLQFQFDADACGFTVADLGDVVKDGNDYVWQTPVGTLREHRGLLTIENTKSSGKRLRPARDAADDASTPAR